MSIIDLSCGSLPASKAHGSRRRWAFLPGAESGSPGLGTVTVCQSRASDSYGLDVTPEGLILFAKLASDGDVYGVSCDRSGLAARCTCPGFALKKTCKHVDTARELMADGVITSQPANR